MTPPLARVLQQLAACVADEASRNPEFSNRLAAILARPSVEAPAGSERGGTLSQPVKGRGNRRAPALVDPLALMEQGEDTLRRALDPLNVEQLKDIVAEHGMDTSKLALKWKSRDRLAELIVSTVRDRLARGDVFRREVERSTPSAT